jgi:hypothetical protein
MLVGCYEQVKRLPGIEKSIKGSSKPAPLEGVPHSK